MVEPTGAGLGFQPSCTAVRISMVCGCGDTCHHDEGKVSIKLG